MLRTGLDGAKIALETKQHPGIERKEVGIGEEGAGGQGGGGRGQGRGGG
jgi:hypothetical protein